MPTYAFLKEEGLIVGDIEEISASITEVLPDSKAAAL